MEQEDKNRVFYIDLAVEVLILLIIVCLAVGIFLTSNIIKTNKENSYKIFMPDVDGLIVGSPVRAMGIEIGYVTKIKPMYDQVYVKFLVTDKSVKIPQGTRATVEFSGMAGSKSLELYFPNEDTYIEPTTPILTVDPPKRLHDAVGLLNDMFKHIGSMITTSSIFARKLQTIEIPSGIGNSNPSEFLNFADDMLDVSIKRVNELGSKLKHGTK